MTTVADPRIKFRRARFFFLFLVSFDFLFVLFGKPPTSFNAFKRGCFLSFAHRLDVCFATVFRVRVAFERDIFDAASDFRVSYAQKLKLVADALVYVSGVSAFLIVAKFVALLRFCTFSHYHDLRFARARVRVARLAFADPQPTPIRNALRSALVLNPDGLLARLAELLLALYLAIISPLSPCWR